MSIWFKKMSPLGENIWDSQVILLEQINLFDTWLTTLFVLQASFRSVCYFTRVEIIGADMKGFEGQLRHLKISKHRYWSVAEID